MILLYLPESSLSLPAGYIHESTDWQVSTSPTFDIIIAESLTDSVNKQSIVFDIDISEYDKLYSRARIHTSNGVFTWSYIDLIVPDDKIRTTLTTNIPTQIMTPDITLWFYTLKAPTFGLQISTSDMVSTTNSKHIATSYVIEDIDGLVVYDRFMDRENLTSIVIEDDILEEDRVYILKVTHYDENGNMSPIASTVFHTTKVYGVELRSQTCDIDPNKDLQILIVPIYDYESMDIVLYEKAITQANIIFAGKSTDYWAVISKNTWSEIDLKRIEYTLYLKLSVRMSSGIVLGPRYFKLTFKKP